MDTYNLGVKSVLGWSQNELNFRYDFYCLVALAQLQPVWVCIFHTWAIPGRDGNHCCSCRYYSDSSFRAEQLPFCTEGRLLATATEYLVFFSVFCDWMRWRLWHHHPTSPLVHSENALYLLKNTASCSVNVSFFSVQRFLMICDQTCPKHNMRDKTNIKISNYIKKKRYSLKENS